MNNIYDVFIIGAGPAGLTAALYAARACLKTAIIEKDYWGGKLNKYLSIENYPGYLENNAPELAEKMMKQIEENNVEHFLDEVENITKDKNLWIIHTNKKTYTTKTVLIASGSKERKIGIENEYEFYGNGVSYCAICDGNLYKNQEVAVVGGGNSAAEESIYLSKIVKTVHLVHRRNEFRADAKFIEQIKKISNIKIYVPNITTKIEVKNNEVIGLWIENVFEKIKTFIECKCVFFYVGILPENNFLKNLDLKISEGGFIFVDEEMKTNIPGIFAAGDIVEKNLRQVVTALSDGAIAAIAMKNYINDEF